MSQNMSHSWIPQSSHLKGHKLISQKALYWLGTITVAGYTFIRILYLYHTYFLLEHRVPVCTNISGLNEHACFPPSLGQQSTTVSWEIHSYVHMYQVILKIGHVT